MIKAILFIVFILLFIAAIGIFVAAFLTNARKVESIKDKARYLDSRSDKAELEQLQKELAEARKKSKTKTSIALVSALVLLVGLFAVPGSFHQVDTGSVAVVRHLGKVVGLRQPGTYFDFWMVNTYETYDTKVQQVEIITAAYSKDGQTMELEVFLQYQIQSENIMKIATEYGGLDALQSRIETQTIEKTKAVMSSDIAMNIIQYRAQFSNDVSDAVRDGISADYYVNVRDVFLTNIDFTDEFERSVENKVIAEQDKQAAITKAEAELEVAKLEAQKQIEAARGNAESQKIVAQATAEASTYNIVELAKVIGYTVNETYLYSVEGVETAYDTKQVESDTIIYLGTKYTIDITSGPGATDFKALVEDYLQYLAYLSAWNGELPSVVAGDDAVSILVP